MIRNILSVLAGIVVAGTTFVITETINGSLHPTPTNLDFSNAEAVQSHFSNQPISFWLIVLLGWLIGSLLCGFLIKRLSQSDQKNLPIIAGIVLTLSAIANFTLLPHPTWFIVVGLLVFIPATLLGHSFYKK